MATAVVHYTELDGSRKLVAPDAVLREAPIVQSEITDNPVERGAPIADNIRKKSETVTLELLVTNTPVAPPLSHAGGAVGSFRGAESAVVLQFDHGFDRVHTLYADLERVQSLGLMFDMETALRGYRDFAIDQLQVERTDKTGDSAKILLTMKKVRFADTQAAPVPRRIPRTLVPVPQGVQPTVAARETLAHRILGGAGLLPGSE